MKTLSFEKKKYYLGKMLLSGNGEKSFKLLKEWNLLDPLFSSLKLPSDLSWAIYQLRRTDERALLGIPVSMDYVLAVIIASSIFETMKTDQKVYDSELPEELQVSENLERLIQICLSHLREFKKEGKNLSIRLETSTFPHATKKLERRRSEGDIFPLKKQNRLNPRAAEASLYDRS